MPVTTYTGLTQTPVGTSPVIGGTMLRFKGTAIHALGGQSSSIDTNDSESVATMGASGLGAASLATMAPDPTVTSIGETDAADSVSQAAAVANNLGYTISNIVASTTVTTGTAVNPVTPVGAAAVAQSGYPSLGSLILIGAVIVAIVLLVKDE
jgi:hypothetical protein